MIFKRRVLPGLWLVKMAVDRVVGGDQSLRRAVLCCQNFRNSPRRRPLASSGGFRLFGLTSNEPPETRETGRMFVKILPCFSWFRSPTPMKTESSSQRHGILLMLLSIVLFAANALLLRAISLAVPAVDGYVASIFRGLVGWVVIHAAFRGRGFEPRRLISSPMLLLRGVVGATGILLFHVTIGHLGAGRAVILNLTYPIFGALMAAAWLKESLRAGQLGWMLVGLVGLHID